MIDLIMIEQNRNNSQKIKKCRNDFYENAEFTIRYRTHALIYLGIP